MGERAGRNPVARPRGDQGHFARPPALGSRVPLPLHAAGRRPGPAARRGRVHLLPPAARRGDRPPDTDLPDARRAPELARAPPGRARRPLPLPVSGVGRARTAPEQAPPARDGVEPRDGRAGDGASPVGRRGAERGRRDRLPRVREAVREHRLQADPQAAGLRLPRRERARACLPDDGGLRADGAGVHSGRRLGAVVARH